MPSYQPPSWLLQLSAALFALALGHSLPIYEKYDTPWAAVDLSVATLVLTLIYHIYLVFHQYRGSCTVGNIFTLSPTSNAGILYVVVLTSLWLATFIVMVATRIFWGLGRTHRLTGTISTAAEFVVMTVILSMTICARMRHQSVSLTHDSQDLHSERLAENGS